MFSFEPQCVLFLAFLDQHRNLRKVLHFPFSVEAKIIYEPKTHFWLPPMSAEDSHSKPKLKISSENYLERILLMVVKSLNWQYHGQAIHPTEKNLYRIIGVVTWAWLFLTSMEAARGQTPYSNCTLWHFNSMFGPSHSAKVCGRCMVFGL